MSGSLAVGYHGIAAAALGSGEVVAHLGVKLLDRLLLVTGTTTSTTTSTTASAGAAASNSGTFVLRCSGRLGLILLGLTKDVSVACLGIYFGFGGTHDTRSASVL